MVLSSRLCLTPFLSGARAEAEGMSIAIEARLESDVNWEGDWFVEGKCLKMGDLMEAEGKQGTDEQ